MKRCDMKGNFEPCSTATQSHQRISRAVHKRFHRMETNRWDSLPSDFVCLTNLGEYWLIERIPDPQKESGFAIDCDFNDDRAHTVTNWCPNRSSNFLQIATGRWCNAKHATKFPCRRSAAVYATQLELRLSEQENQKEG